MRFAFDDMQLEFQQEVRNLLAKTCTPALDTGNGASFISTRKVSPSRFKPT